MGSGLRIGVSGLRFLLKLEVLISGSKAQGSGSRILNPES